MKRRFMSGLISLLLLVSFIGAGCPAPPPVPEAEVGKPEGTLIVALPTFGAENWLTQRASTPTVNVMTPLYDTLLTRDLVTGLAAPGLAEKWEMSKDTKSYTFDLVKGVQFHGGWGELTAEDVKYTMEVVMSPGSTNELAGKLTKYLEDIEIINPYRFVMHLKEPLILFEYDLLDLQAKVGILCKKYVQTVGFDEAARYPIGSGPFRFVKSALGNYVEFEAVENHWRKIPYVKRLILKLVPEEATRIAMLKTGEVQFAAISAVTAPEVEAAPNCKVRCIKQALDVTLMLLGQYLPTEKGYDPTCPWNEGEKGIKVRKALSMAINRQEIIDYIIGGYGTLEGRTLSFFLPPEVHASADLAWAPTYDPEKAKALLHEAGYADLKTVVVTVDLCHHAGNPMSSQIAEAIAMYWEKLGITVKRQTTDYVTIEAAQADRNFVACFVHTVGFRPEPWATIEKVAPMYTRDCYYGSYPELDAMLTKIAGELDYNKRVELTHELGQWVYDRTCTISLFYQDLLWGMAKNLEWPNYPGWCGPYMNRLEYMQFTK